MKITKSTSIRCALAAAGVALAATSTAVVSGATADEAPRTDTRALAAHAAGEAAREAELARVARAARAAADREAKARAAAEAARAAAAGRANRKARAAAAAAAAKRAPAWIRPMRGDLTSTYGFRWGTTHAGVDIAAGGGAPIYAAAAGVVAEARCTSPSCEYAGSLGMPGYGNKVDIVHAGGVTTRYGHMSRFVVRAGQRVRAGQLIGYEGETGNVTGPHLHLEVLIGGDAVNPVPFFARKGVDLRQG